MGLKLDRPVSSMSDFDLYGIDPICLGRLDRALVAAEKKFQEARRFGETIARIRATVTFFTTLAKP